mgnify:CR=1 FL=1
MLWYGNLGACDLKLLEQTDLFLKHSWRLVFVYDPGPKLLSFTLKQVNFEEDALKGAGLSSFTI